MTCRVCKEVFEEVCILASGDVVCSCIDAEGSFVTGNIQEQRIDDIFRGEQYDQLRRILLDSQADSHCSALGCDCPFKNVEPTDDLTAAPAIKKIRLETISFCNLRCPECVVSKWYEQSQGAAKRGGMARGLLRKARDWFRRRPDPTPVPEASRFARLPIEAVKEVLDDTKETLEHLWLYNYGEPFLDRNLLELLRYADKVVPRAWVYTHTNGNVFPEGWIETIVREELLDAMSFSIDGTKQSSYEKYRVGGQFETAFGNMLEFVRQKKRQEKTKPDITWQYILFRWNDSDEELARAQELAEEHGLNLQWILTHTEGKSERFTEDSEEYYRLKGIKHFSSDILAKQHDR